MIKLRYPDVLIVWSVVYVSLVSYKCDDISMFVRWGYCFTPYQRLRLYNGAPFSRPLRHAGDTEDVFSA